MQNKSTATLKGIDVSHHNGTIDWNSVKNDGIDFAYLKSSEGVSFVSPTFATNVHGARSVGISVGAYHFARPTENDPVDEAIHFFNTMKNNGLLDFGDIMPVLDLESPTDPNLTTGEFLVNWAKTFINELVYLTQRSVMVYTGNWFIDQFNITGLSDLPLWISNYGTSQPPDSGGWSIWTAFQYSESGNINGVIGDVDMNVGTSLDELYGWVVCNPYKVRYTTSDLNVRLGCSTDYSVKQVIPAGTKVTITKLNPSWAYAIEFDGWISRKYLRQ